MNAPRMMPLGDALVAEGVLRPEKLQEALAEHRKTGRLLGRVLVENGYVTEEQIARTLSKQLKIPYVDLRRFELNSDVVRHMTEMQARRYRAIVLEERKESYLVGLVDALDLRVQDEIASLLRRPIDLALVTNDQLVQSLDRAYRKTEQINEFAKEVEKEVQIYDLDAGQLAVSDEEAPVMRLLHTLVDEAMKLNASDIHVEPRERRVMIRFRIDGVLYPQAEADARIGRPMLVRLKLMAALDIAERRLPQDGRMTVRTGSKVIDVRLSTLPSQFGESAVLRLLPRQAGTRKLESLGMKPDMRARFEQAVHAPHGLVLVTGPTGSGKSTTLYAALQELNKPGVKILTCEDPVEHTMEGIVQVQINEKIQYGFPTALRAFLRHDPDIILVGEIRDGETAQIAARAAMTGHLVLSTLHTNDTVSTPGRLVDMGVPGYMLATTLRAVLAQRLLRVNCNECAKPVAVGPDDEAFVSHYLGAGGARGYRKGAGCTQCNGTGFHGRTGIHELLEITEPLVTALQADDGNAFTSEAHRQIGDQGLVHEAVRRAAAGITTVHEARELAQFLD